MDIHVSFVIDIDECSLPGYCSQLCKNSEGSFKCGCQPGYYLDIDDQATCRAISTLAKSYLSLVN